MSHLIDILIPTFNNPEYLHPCINSILTNCGTAKICKITVINNGNPESVKGIVQPLCVDVIQMKENAGWEGGLKIGLAQTNAPFVIFMNDDTFIPSSSTLWMNRLLNHFRFPDCAAAGPASNVVVGWQNIFNNSQYCVFKVPYLIGFCVMLRREYLEAVGGVDDSLPGGDDFDLCMRLRKSGKYLICNKEVFVYHHGFKTGERLYGSYWNSADMQQKTNDALIRKHGVKYYWETMNAVNFDYGYPPYGIEDNEGNIVRKHVFGDRILELGCGARKTVENAVGMDIIKKGDMIPNLAETSFSVSDIVGNVHEELPFKNEEFDCLIARHILEHHHDPISTIEKWGKVVKKGGRIIIAVPDHGRANTIPMNVEHCSAYTQDSLKKLMEISGWKQVVVEDCENNVSFVGVFERNGNGHGQI